MGRKTILVGDGKFPWDDKAEFDWVPLDDVAPWARNPRKNDGRPVEEVVASIRRFGFLDPLVVWRSRGRLIAGHTRIKAMRSILADDPGFIPKGGRGPGLVPVRFAEFDSEAEADAASITVNRTGEFAEWDDGLASLLEELRDDGIPGWDDDEIEAIIAAALPTPTGPEPPIPDLPADPVSRSGELYELGPHRLYCGDSTSAAAYKAVLGRKKAHALWTDPPYGVAVNDVKNVQEARRLHRRTDGRMIPNDSLTPEKLEVLLRTSLGEALTHCRKGAAWYVSAPGGPLFQVFGRVLGDLKVWRHTLVWVKDQFVFGRTDYHYRTEPIFYGWAPGAAHRWVAGRDQDNVFEIPRPRVSKDHPTMKPPELIERCLANHLVPGQVVLDNFAGSGSTMIAAAKLGCRAAMIELDPGFCDVIRRRWTRFAIANDLEVGTGGLEDPS